MLSAFQEIGVGGVVIAIARPLSTFRKMLASIYRTAFFSLIESRLDTHRRIYGSGLSRSARRRCYNASATDEGSPPSLGR